MLATLKKIIWGLAIMLCCKSSYAELNVELKQNIGKSCQEKAEIATQVMTQRQNGQEFIDMVQSADKLQKTAQTPEQRGLAQFYAALALRVSRQPVEATDAAKAVRIAELRQMVLASCQQKQI